MNKERDFRYFAWAENWAPFIALSVLNSFLPNRTEMLATQAKAVVQIIFLSAGARSA